MSDLVIISPPGNPAERLFSMSEVGNIVAIIEKNGRTVRVIDCIYFKNVENIVSETLEENPRIIIIIFQWTHHPFSKWAELLLTEFSNTKINVPMVCCGRGATLFDTEILNQYHTIDVVIKGESEMTIEQIINISDFKSQIINQRGITFKLNGSITINPSQEPVKDLDTLPFPDRQYLKNKWLYPIAPMYTSRFCYANCNFCPNLLYWCDTKDQNYRARSASLVVDELEAVFQNYNTRTFYFVEDNFFVDGKKGKERAYSIAQEIIKRNLKIRFHIESRVNDVEPELFALLKKAGLRKVFLGIESGCQSVLDRYNKGTTVLMNKLAIGILNDLRIDWEPGFIMFDPFTTIQELKNNCNFIRDTNLHLCKGSTGSKLFHPLVIYPGASVIKKIPAKAFVGKSAAHADGIPYKIMDPKARICFNLVQYYQKIMIHLERQLLQYAYKQKQKLQDGQAETIGKKDYSLFQKNLAKWNKGRPTLDLEIFENIIENVDSYNSVDDTLIQAIQNIIKNKVQSYNSFTRVGNAL